MARDTELEEVKLYVMVHPARRQFPAEVADCQFRTTCHTAAYHLACSILLILLDGDKLLENILERRQMVALHDNSV